MGLHEIKSFCTIKEMGTRFKKLLTEQQKTFASYTSDRELITRIYRNLKKLNSPQNSNNSPPRK
jgi:hypothetical protein